MDRYRDFTLSPTRYPLSKVQAFIEKLKTRHQQYILIIDPAIPTVEGYGPYVRGCEQDIFIRDVDGDLMRGRVWPG